MGQVKISLTWSPGIFFDAHMETENKIEFEVYGCEETCLKLEIHLLVAKKSDGVRGEIANLIIENYMNF